MSEDLTTYENSDGHWVSEQEHCRIIAEKDRAYQQLMEKAVRFAECLTDDCRCTPEEVNTSPECAFVRAQVFLKSPEVQAWKEQPK